MEIPVNQILQGDCLEIMKTFPDKSIDLVLTDPPYGMDYQSARRIDRYEKIENDAGIEWFPELAIEIMRVLKDDRHFYIFCNDYALSFFRQYMIDCGFNVKRALVWVKNNHTSGDLDGDYANKTEFILWGHKGRRLLNGGRDTNVVYGKREQTNFHPTQKPDDLMSYFIQKSTEREEIVLDMYVGVEGSTYTLLARLRRSSAPILIRKEDFSAENTSG